MKKWLSLILFIPAFFSCGQDNTEYAEQIIIDRIHYVYNLKDFIDQHIWESVDKKEYDVPLIYYADSACYIANPTERFIGLFQPELIADNSELKIYRTFLLDSLPFHMEVAVSYDEDNYAHKSPFMKCSSVETTNKLIPDVPSTEVWATMVLHEYFHGFQFKHPAFFEHFSAVIAEYTQETLITIYSQNTWFREYIEEENRLLLSALASDDMNEIEEALYSFLYVRNERRKNTRQVLGIDIAQVEQMFETMEGTARYIEYSLYDKFLYKEPDIMKSDTMYHSYSYFSNFNFEENEWLYKIGINYFYATGFNIARLLDKLHIDYKTSIFNGNEALDEILFRHFEDKLNLKI